MKVAKYHTTEKIIDAPLTMTTSWQDIGTEYLATVAAADIALWLTGLLNDSDILKLRVKCYMDDGTGPFYTQIQTIGADTVALNVEEYTIDKTNQPTFNMVLPLGISSLASQVRIEAKVETAGATPAEITTAAFSIARGEV